MKINKIIISFLTALCLILSVQAFADQDLSSLRATKSAKTANKAMRSATYSRTDVHVLNNSPEHITVKVPGTPINDLLFPGEIEDIYSNVYFDAIMVVLYDEDGYEFFRDYVPNHSIVEVSSQFMGRSATAGKKQSKVKAIIKK